MDVSQLRSIDLQPVGEQYRELLGRELPNLRRARARVDAGLPGQVVTVAPGDYDGDSKTDYAYFWAPGGYWYIIRSSTGAGSHTYYGSSSMTPVAADYDGDGKTDIAHYDPGTRIFWIFKSTTGASVGIDMSGVSPPGSVPVLRTPQ